MKAIFRVDGSAQIGGGHVLRCLALADRMNAHGWSCTFICGKGTSETVPTLEKSIHAVEEFKISAANEPRDEFKHLINEVDLLIVDHYDIGRKFESAYKNQSKQILIIDDLANRSHDCDILVDPTPGRLSEDYQHFLPLESVVVTGSHYALLRDEFSCARQKNLARNFYDQSSSVKIFVCFGAVDKFDVTSKVLDALEECTFDFDAHIVLGPNAHNKKTVVSRIINLSANISCHIWSENISSLMESCDLAIGGGGAMALERCSLGLPSIIITLASNQESSAAMLDHAKAVVSLGQADSVSTNDIYVTLNRLISSPQLLAKMRHQAFKICDGLGVSRVISQISPPYSKEKKPITLRPAKLEDRDLIYSWQSHPGSRRFFKNPETPNWDEHVEWYSNTLDDPQRLLNIILHDRIPVGYLRLDSLGTSNEYEVSVMVVPEAINKGIGTGALRQARTLLPEAKFTADVSDENEASRRLFMRTGYKLEGGRFISSGSAAAVIN